MTSTIDNLQRFRVSCSGLSLDTYLDRVENFTSSVATNAHLRVLTLRRRPNHSSHIATLTSTLRTFHRTVNDIRCISLAFNGEWKPLTASTGTLTYRYWRWSLFPRFSNTAPNSGSLLHVKLMESLDKVKPISEQKRLKILFGLLLQILISLRCCEAALYTLDEEWMVIVGSSNPVDAAHRTAQIFVHYAVYRLCIHLPEATRNELATIFDRDNLMNPIMLKPIHRSSMNRRKESIRQLVARYYHQHPCALPTFFVLFFIAGVKNWIFAWIPVVVVLSCSRGDLGDCRSSDPSTVHEIMHVLTPPFIIGRLLFLDYRIAAPSVSTISIVLVYTSALIYYISRLCGKRDVDVHPLWSMQNTPYRTSALNWSVVFALLWQGVVSALLQDVSIPRVLNTLAVHILSYTMVTIAVDRTGELRASTELKQISARSTNEAPGSPSHALGI